MNINTPKRKIIYINTPKRKIILTSLVILDNIWETRPFLLPNVSVLNVLFYVFVFAARGEIIRYRQWT